MNTKITQNPKEKIINCCNTIFQCCKSGNLHFYKKDFWSDSQKLDVVFALKKNKIIKGGMIENTKIIEDAKIVVNHTNSVDSLIFKLKYSYRVRRFYFVTSIYNNKEGKRIGLPIDRHNFLEHFEELKDKSEDLIIILREQYCAKKDLLFLLNLCRNSKR